MADGAEPLAELLGFFVDEAGRATDVSGGRGGSFELGPTDMVTFVPTERQVAELVAAGATNKGVAEKLFMSVATVKTNLTRVYSKVGVTFT